MQARTSLSAVLMTVALAAATAAVAVPGRAAAAQSGFQSERLMAWQWGKADDQVLGVSAFSVARDGSIYVGTSGHVKKFAPDGRLLLVTWPQLDRVARFAVDSKGCVYVVHGAGQDLISKLDRQGALLSDDPAEASGRGGLGSERLAFDSEGRLVWGEVLSFADRVAVECVNHRIATTFDAITVDKKDRLHVLIHDRNPYGAGSAIFDTEGYLVGVGPGGHQPIRFDGAGRKYVFRSVGDWSQAAALTMYSPTGGMLPGPLMLPADKIVLPGVPTPVDGEIKFLEGPPELLGWSVDDSGNFYCYGGSKKEVPVDVGNGCKIYSDLYVFKLDPAGHVVGRSAPLPEPSPDWSEHYEPQIDSSGRVYYLEFYPDRIEVMRGTFTP